MLSAEHFDVKFTSREVSAWGGLALLKKMMDGMGVFQAIQSWQLPMPGSNRGYAPAQPRSGSRTIMRARTKWRIG